MSENEKNSENDKKENTTRNNGKFIKGNKEGNRFSSSNQPSSEAKKRGWAEKKSLQQIKDEIIEKSFSKVNELLQKEELTSSELRDIFKEAVNMSGFKSQTQDLNITPPTININGLNI